MATVATGFHISEEIVTQVRDEVVAQPLADFLRDELPFMQPGLTAFDLWIYGDACRSDGPDAANALRAGMLVAHRTVRLACEGSPLPQAADALLSAWSGQILSRSIWKPRSIEKTRQTIDRGFDDSRAGISLLIDTVLTRPPSRGGATFLLGLHLASMDPEVYARTTYERIPVRPRQASHDRRSQLPRQ